MKKNILVVDDSALMRRAICDIINSGNEYEATDTCRDGLEAYEKITSNSYDAVLLDINMPRMNGLELLQKLQKENIRATVVVVSSLAKEDAKITIQAMEYGAVDFITKPENIVEAKGVQFREDLTRLLNSADENEICSTCGSGEGSGARPVSGGSICSSGSCYGGRNRYSSPCIVVCGSPRSSASQICSSQISSASGSFCSGASQVCSSACICSACSSACTNSRA